MTTPRTIIPTDRCQHEHGDRNHYLKCHCKCPACRTAGAKYYRDWKAGNRQNISSQSLAGHLDRLLGASWTLDEIAAAAGLHADTVRKISRQSRKTLRSDTARRLLAIDPDRPRPDRDAGHAPIQSLLASSSTLAVLAFAAALVPAVIGDLFYGCAMAMCGFVAGVLGWLTIRGRSWV